MQILNYKLASVAALMLGLSGIGQAQAGLLDFSGNICSANAVGSGALTSCGNFAFINQSYGDVANADITYTDLIMGRSLRWWNTGYNNLTGVAWGGTGDGFNASWNRIEIKPVGNFSVTLNSFDLGAFPQTQRNTHLQILDALTSSVLLDYGDQLIGLGNEATAFLPSLTSANGLAIEWRDTAYNVGIDNIDFSVTANATGVPVPATVWLLGLGLVGLMRFARKK